LTCVAEDSTIGLGGPADLKNNINIEKG